MDVVQASMMKKALKVDQDQRARLIDSAKAPEEPSHDERPVGRNLDVKV